jgi:hypothetical protein
LDAYCTLVGGDPFANGVRRQLADRLMFLFSATESKDWIWFEDLLAYDNARLPQALLQTGRPARHHMSRSVSDRSVGSCRFRLHHRDISDQLGTRASADSGRNPKRSISSHSKRRQRFQRALLHGRQMAAQSGRQGQCARSVGFWEKTT